MSEVNININGKNYRIGCDPGEESRVQELGKYIDAQVQSIAQSGGTAAEAHLLVLGSIIMCDELFELKDMLKQTQDQYKAVSEKLEKVTEQLEIEQTRNAETIQSSADNIDDPEIADVIAGLATRIEAIAERLHKT